MEELEEALTGIRACRLAWMAVNSSDRSSVVAQCGLTKMRNASWAEGVDLIDEVAHSGEDRFSTVLVTSPIDGWTLVIGSWCGLPHLNNVFPVTELCRELSARFGAAQAYFHSEQNDGEAWLLAENGAVVRRWLSEYPELALGEPRGVERRLLDAYGIAGKPEDLDPDDDDRLTDWAASRGECYATTVAAESSIDPTTISRAVPAPATMLVASAPEFGPSDPLAGSSS